jgi:hypothetical protein
VLADGDRRLRPSSVREDDRLLRVLPAVIVERVVGARALAVLDVAVAVEVRRTVVGTHSQRGDVEDALAVSAPERAVFGSQVRRFPTPLIKAHRHLRRVIVERLAAEQRRPCGPIDERAHVHAELPRLPCAQPDAEHGAALGDAAFLVEPDLRAAPVAVSLVPERRGERVRLDPALSLAVAVRFGLHDVGEIRSERELEPYFVLLLRQVLHDILVHALGDEAVAAQGDRRRRALLWRTSR